MHKPDYHIDNLNSYSYGHLNFQLEG